jgi:hypothetical protein
MHVNGIENKKKQSDVIAWGSEDKKWQVCQGCELSKCVMSTQAVWGALRHDGPRAQA